MLVLQLPIFTGTEPHVPRLASFAVCWTKAVPSLSAVQHPALNGNSGEVGRVETGRWSGRRWRGGQAAGWRIWRTEDNVLPGLRIGPQDESGVEPKECKDQANEAEKLSGGGILCEVRIEIERWLNLGFCLPVRHMAVPD